MNERGEEKREAIEKGSKSGLSGLREKWWIPLWKETGPSPSTERKRNVTNNIWHIATQSNQANQLFSGNLPCPHSPIQNQDQRKGLSQVPLHHHHYCKQSSTSTTINTQTQTKENILFIHPAGKFLLLPTAQSMGIGFKNSLLIAPYFHPQIANQYGFGRIHSILIFTTQPPKKKKCCNAGKGGGSIDI